MWLFAVISLFLLSIGIQTITLKWSHEILLWSDWIASGYRLKFKDVFKIAVILWPLNLLIGFILSGFFPINFVILFLLDTIVFKEYLCIDYLKAAILNIIWALFTLTIAWFCILAFVYLFES